MALLFGYHIGSSSKAEDMMRAAVVAAQKYFDEMYK